MAFSVEIVATVLSEVISKLRINGFSWSSIFTKLPELEEIIAKDVAAGKVWYQIVTDVILDFTAPPVPNPAPTPVVPPVAPPVTPPAE